MLAVVRLVLAPLLLLGAQQVLDTQNTDVTPPKLLVSVDPVPPHRLFRGKKHLVVQCTVNENGDVSQAKVTTSAGKKYDEAALAAVRQYRFKPAEKDGKPLAVSLFVDVTLEYR